MEKRLNYLYIYLFYACYIVANHQGFGMVQLSCHPSLCYVYAERHEVQQMSQLWASPLVIYSVGGERPSICGHKVHLELREII